MAHPCIFATILLVLSATCAALGGIGGDQRRVSLFLGTLAFFLTLAGIGAVFGKVLGDFLRNVNG